VTSTATHPASPRGRFALTPAAIIVVCACALLALGLTILFSASAAFKQGPFFYLDKQVVGVVVAAATALAVSRVDLEWVRRRVWWVGAIAVAMLLLVLVPGLGIAVKGSRRWLGHGSARLQVSEFAKIALVFCLAHYLALNQNRIHDLKRGFLLPLAIIGAFALPIVLEPDFGMAALFLLVGLALLYLTGAKWRHMLATVGLAAAGFTVLVLHNPNRLQRLTEYLGDHPPYQLVQAQAAFAAGGLEGVGLGQGRQQLSYLPEAHTDFIGSVVGEELGLGFTLGVVAVFVVIFLAGLAHLQRAPNLFQFLIVAGSLLFITAQALVNLLMVTGLIPPKGMSLPFLSAGLSNLLLMGVLVGLIINTQRSWPRPGLGHGRRAIELAPEPAPECST
jgi:cell division protein FtsW